MTIRRRVHEIIQPAQRGDLASRVFDIFILSLIALNVLAIILESVQDIRASWGKVFWLFEVISVLVFSVEYVLRLWTCVEEPRYARPVLGRLRAAFSPLLLIDLLSPSWALACSPCLRASWEPASSRRPSAAIHPSRDAHIAARR